jgi:hypothetical protein
VSDSFRAYDAIIFPGDFHVEPEAFSTGFADDEVAAMDRHVYLADELGRCSYFTEQERSMHFTMDEGTTTSFEMKLPGAGATRDMLGLLRQLFGTERASFASMLALLRSHVDAATSPGQALLDVLQPPKSSTRVLTTSASMVGSRNTGQVRVRPERGRTSARSSNPVPVMEQRPEA